MAHSVDGDYQLDHRYTRERGRVYLSGVQALVRLPMLQHERDTRAGLDTAGFISGYRGSPLGTFDMALWQARAHLESHQVHFEPGVNEDLAATAVWGSQQANLMPGARHDGVFGIWYGKGPGVDRSCDALKHANYAGTAPHGGVLALCGDDPAAKSSSIAHQSEHALIHCGIPVLNPANVQEYLDLGVAGFALSRYAGCWVGFKCLTDTVDSAASVEIGPERMRLREPDYERPPGLHIAWSNLPLQVEHRLYQQRLPAAQAFVRANRLDRVVMGSEQARLGIVTAGKAYLDVRQALEELGIDDARAREMGLAVYKVAMTWPLEPEGLGEFASGLESLLVVEEKRPILEDQIARLLYNLPERPLLVGKRDEAGAPCIPAEGELSPQAVGEAIRAWIGRRAPEAVTSLQAPPAPPPQLAATGRMRLPAFCSGCPHNSSTVVPEGSAALGGIGCHGMAVWLPGRNTLAVTQMGGEGANWIGIAPFTDTPHMFQNVGDGTYFHSGLLAIRAAVTAGVNLTYKVLVNGAVAMTGGQLVDGEALEGEVTVPEVARQLAAEGVERIAVVGPEPEKYPKDAGFPAGVTFHHRDEIDRVQRDLRGVRGVSALIYDQTCAAEARRLRRKGEFPEPDRRVLIQQDVCEGCGDCSVQSNCISIEPVETAVGRKRRINQSSCNKDFSCLKGYCPSFVTVLGGELRTSKGADADESDPAAGLPMPPLAPCDDPWNVLLAGIGGSGVVTVGAILAMAAHLEGRGCSELDVTGLAQKNGPVSSHVRIAHDPDRLHATRIAVGAADLVIGCDLVVATSPENLPRIGKERTTAVVNGSVAPTADFAGDPDMDLSAAPLEHAVREAAGPERTHVLPVGEWATALLGDAIGANMMLLGYAFQRGQLPVSLAAIDRAIDLNGRAIAMNRRAFAYGRLAAHDRAALEKRAAPLLRVGAETLPTTLDEVVRDRERRLTDYQNEAYARRYRTLVDRARAAEKQLGREGLALAVAHGYHRLLAYKDEYEVARLFTTGALQEQLAREFQGETRLRFHLSPQFLPDWLAPRDPETGRLPKWTLGPWILVVFRVLARLKFLRGTALDLPGRTAHRKMERTLIRDYERTLEEVLGGLDAGRFDVAVELAALPQHIRGYDSVKEQTVHEARERKAELLTRFREV